MAKTRILQAKKAPPAPRTSTPATPQKAPAARTSTPTTPQDSDKSPPKKKKKNSPTGLKYDIIYRYCNILRCVADCCKRGTVAFTCEEIQQTAATASLPRLQIEIRNGGKTDEPQEDPRRLICCSVFFICVTNHPDWGKFKDMINCP